MSIWWRLHKNIFTEVDRDRIEDLTGCIPLYLTPFATSGDKQLSNLEPDIWQVGQFADVQREVCKFADLQLTKSPV